MSASDAGCAVCRAPGGNRCAVCRSVAYCGKEHQVQDWPSHKNSCRACKLVTLAGKRSVVSTKDLEEGEVISRETPLVLGPYHLMVAALPCPGCLEMIAPQFNKSRCRRCGWPACSADCRGLTDPSQHGAECEVLCAVKSSLIRHTFESLTFLRCLLLQKRDPEKWKSLQKIATEVVRTGSRNKREGQVFLENCILKALASKTPRLIPDVSLSTINEVVALVETCGVPLKSTDTGSLVGICDIASRMQHSCAPNTRIYVEPPKWKDGLYEPPRVVIRAAKTIPTGEALTTCFLSTPLLWLWHRQDLLFTFRREICSCARCSDRTEFGTHYSTLICQSCKGWLLPLRPTSLNTTWKCHGKCGAVYSMDHAIGMHAVCSKMVENLRLRGTIPATHELEKVLSKIQRVLHPHHDLCIVVKRQIINSLAVKGGGSYSFSALSDSELQRAAELCDELFDVMLKPHLLLPTNDNVLEFLVSCMQVKVAMVERKSASGEWNAARVEEVKKECCELYARKVRISTGITPKMLSDKETFAALKWSQVKMWAWCEASPQSWDMP